MEFKDLSWIIVNKNKKVPVLDPKRDFAPPRKHPFRMLISRLKRMCGMERPPTYKN